MNKTEAASLLRAAIDRHTAGGYGDLANQVDTREYARLTGPSGKDYQIEIDTRWEAVPNGDIRVIGNIDDGSFVRAMFPLTETRLIERVGEP